MKALLAAAAAIALLGATDALAKTKEKPKDAPTAAPIGEPLAAALPTYAQFQADISLVNGGSIQEPKDIERALDKAAALNRDSLTRGLMAYGALTAARNQTFVDSVRKTAAFYGHDKMVNGLLNSVKYAASLDGGSQAVASIVRVAGADSARIVSAGEQVKSRAREAQSLAWGKAAAGVAAPRTARLKALALASGTPILAPEVAERLKITVGGADPSSDPSGFGGENFWRTISAPQTMSAVATPNVLTPPAKSDASVKSDASLVSLTMSSPPAVTFNETSGGADIRSKMVTLAALYALDATQDRPSDVEKLLNDNITNGCLQGAQLQFYQCVASAKFNYENMACVGEAGLITVGGCVKDIAR